jgi:hypothetical protein
VTCESCRASNAGVVALRVGAMFRNTQIARIDLCDRCRLFVWTHWPLVRR